MNSFTKDVLRFLTHALILYTLGLCSVYVLATKLVDPPEDGVQQIKDILNGTYRTISSYYLLVLGAITIISLFILHLYYITAFLYKGPVPQAGKKSPVPKLIVVCLLSTTVMFARIAYENQYREISSQSVSAAIIIFWNVSWEVMTFGISIYSWAMVFWFTLYKVALTLVLVVIILIRYGLRRCCGFRVSGRRRDEGSGGAGTEEVVDLEAGMGDGGEDGGSKDVRHSGDTDVKATTDSALDEHPLPDKTLPL